MLPLSTLVHKKYIIFGFRTDALSDFSGVMNRIFLYNTLKGILHGFNKGNNRYMK